MQKLAAVLAISALIGAATVAAPGRAEARFGAGAIADAVAELSTVQQVQHRSGQRTYRPPAPRRTYTQPQYDTVSPYRYPGSRGALDSCSFC